MENDNNNIKGYSKLSEPAKNIFDRVYSNHHTSFPNWIAVKVKETRTYIRVEFTNGEWLHYLPNGTWY
jgi:hypothetical protein